MKSRPRGYLEFSARPHRSPRTGSQALRHLLLVSSWGQLHPGQRPLSLALARAPRKTLWRVWSSGALSASLRPRQEPSGQWLPSQEPQTPLGPGSRSASGPTLPSSTSKWPPWGIPMPKTRPCGSRPPAKCLLALGLTARPVLKGSQPRSSRMTRTAWRKVRVRPGALSCLGLKVAGCGAGPSSHASCPQSHPGLPAQASTRTAMGSHQLSWRSRTGQDHRPHSAWPRCCPGEGAPRDPHTPLVLRLALPQASASGSEDTVAKAKQSRSEKKARKVCWGPAPLGRSQAGQTTHPLRTLPTRGWRIPSLGALRRMQ